MSELHERRVRFEQAESETAAVDNDFVQKRTSNRHKLIQFFILTSMALLWIFTNLIHGDDVPSSAEADTNKILSHDLLVDKVTLRRAVTSKIVLPAGVELNSLKSPSGCISKLPNSYYHGKHIVVPPEGPITLVCCNTTKGFMNIAIHTAWAPIGAANFLEMVKSGFFSSQVPLFRAIKGFLVQFGLAGDPGVQEAFHQKHFAHGYLRDDPSWLPLGPPGREINGTFRFQKGYISYAGAGVNSRGTQIFIAFENSKYLGGGSPWEVPFGQLVGEESYKTLGNIYTKYNEKPSQGKIMNRGLEYIRDEFPLLDIMTRCDVVKEGIPWKLIKWAV